MTRAPFASFPKRSRGRAFPLEPLGDSRKSLRSAFQRDRDRIVHATAFRRLRDKTQVFVAPQGDHYRVRLTHSLEVAQIARVIARELRLDEDLTEAVALAHDLGHPPFGHAGEAALGAALADAGGFDHNAHTLRILTRLETPYVGHDGLNLSWETLEGLAKHNGPVLAPGWALSEVDDAFPLDLPTWPSLEAQVAALADDIAYDNHDIEDGLRAGVLDLDDMLELPVFADGWRAVERRHRGAPRDRQLRALIRDQIGAMVDDLLGETRRRTAGLTDVSEVRAAGKASVAFSPAMEATERGIKRFMYERLYYHPAQAETARRAHSVVVDLFAAYADDPSLMETTWHARLPAEQPARSRHIADYIAGMTDGFALARYAEIARPT